jgi:N-acetyl-gamma-glutamyl-phosphate reductase
MTHNNAIRAAVLGASGYSGAELLALLRRHASIRAVYATSESAAGERVPGAYGGANGSASGNGGDATEGLRYVRAEEVPFADVDVVFTCLPHGESGAWSLRAQAAGARVVDLSSDLRDGRDGAVYGLPELWREKVRGAGLVANPGCYPTGILLAVAPLLADGLLDRGRPLIVNAASGVTGAGRSAKRELLYGEVAEDYRAYAVGNTHRHVPEIARSLAVLAGDAVPFVFTPHLLPVRRGILETLYVPLADGVTAEAVLAAWQAAYAGERFVDVWTDGIPSLRSVVGRNVVALGVTAVRHAGGADVEPMVVVVAAFDNLVKGAAGQALQNANLMLGLCEGEGLPQ